MVVHRLDFLRIPRQVLICGVLIFLPIDRVSGMRDLPFKKTSCTDLLFAVCQAVEFPRDQRTRFSDLDVFEITTVEPFSGEENVCVARAFNKSFIFDLHETFLVTFGQPFAGHVGVINLFRGVGAKPFLLCGRILSSVLVGDVIVVLLHISHQPYYHAMPERVCTSSSSGERLLYFREASFIVELFRICLPFAASE